MKLYVHEFELPLQHTFTISRESISVQSTIVVELVDGDVRGYGEATTNKYYGATRESITEALSRVKPKIEFLSSDDPVSVWESLHPQLADQTFAQCALDQATWDLYGKRRGVPTYQMWDLTWGGVPHSCYTLGIDDPDVMVEKLKEMPGWPVYKIKLGNSQDLEIVKHLREHTDALFRVDVNCGWTAEETVHNSRKLKSLGVEFIEQPLPSDDWAGHRQVFLESALPILADESCRVFADVPRCEGHFHGINIKLVKCGGLTPALRMIAQAKRLGLKVMVGCMTESSVGISAIAQLLPLLDFVDMDGAVLLKEDIACGARVVRGVCHLADGPGNGVSLTESAERLRRR